MEPFIQWCMCVVHSITTVMACRSQQKCWASQMPFWHEQQEELKQFHRLALRFFFFLLLLQGLCKLCPIYYNTILPLYAKREREHIRPPVSLFFCFPVVYTLYIYKLSSFLLSFILPFSSFLFRWAKSIKQHNQIIDPSSRPPPPI